LVGPERSLNEKGSGVEIRVAVFEEKQRKSGSRKQGLRENSQTANKQAKGGGGNGRNTVATRQNASDSNFEVERRGGMSTLYSRFQRDAIQELITNRHSKKNTSPRIFQGGSTHTTQSAHALKKEREPIKATQRRQRMERRGIQKRSTQRRKISTS